MRRGVSLVEALIALAVGAVAVVMAMEFFGAGHRLFGRVQGSLDIEGDARLLVVNLVRDLSEAHRVRPPGTGELLRLVRYLPEEGADFASRTDEAYAAGAAAGAVRDRSFAAHEVRYLLDPVRHVVTRREVPGTWHWVTPDVRPGDPPSAAPVVVRFDTSGTESSREMARNVTQLNVEHLGYDRTGKLDLIAALAPEDLPYPGDEARHAASALVLIRLTARMDTPAREAEAPRELDLVTRVWIEGRRADGLARPFKTTADESGF